MRNVRTIRQIRAAMDAGEYVSPAEYTALKRDYRRHVKRETARAGIAKVAGRDES
jgi:hypothetical protein